LEASSGFVSDQSLPYEGYLIASHLAGIHEFRAAIKAAEAVRDDKWKRKSWSTIALYLAEAESSIARIGQGNLVHPLGQEAQGRDMARIFVANGSQAAVIPQKP
jgi:hypothetical protein